MANKMERFTNHARRILALSQEATEKLGHIWIEPEHILIALSRANDTSAYHVLSDVGPKRIAALTNGNSASGD